MTVLRTSPNLQITGARPSVLPAVGIPIPKTWVWYDAALAKDWARKAEYPLVLKLLGGASAENVTLVRSFEEAERWLNRLFGRGVHRLSDFYLKPWPWGKRRFRSAAKLILKGIPPQEKLSEYAWERHKNYVLFQEFLPGNDFDTRVAVVGNRAFALRRFNRENDFRASGSGSFDTDPSKIDLEAVRLAFRVADRLKTQNPAYSIVRIALTAGASPTRDRSFVEDMLRTAAKGTKLTLFTDEFRCPIPAGPLVRALWEFAAQPRSDVYHLGGSERLSRWEIGELLARRYPELRRWIQPGSVADYHGPPRPPDLSMRSDKLQTLRSFRLPGFRHWLNSNSSVGDDPWDGSASGDR